MASPGTIRKNPSSREWGTNFEDRCCRGQNASGSFVNSATTDHKGKIASVCLSVHRDRGTVGPMFLPGHWSHVLCAGRVSRGRMSRGLGIWG